MEKLLEDAGIKLSVFVSDLFGVSGRAMLSALVDGERDPEVLAGCARGRMRPKIPMLVQALTGSFDAHHAFLSRTMLSRIDGLDATINAVTAQIETEIVPFQPVADRFGHDPGSQPARGPGDHRRDRGGHGPVPDRGSSRVLGRDVSGQQRVRRQALLRPHPQGRPGGCARHWAKRPRRLPARRTPTARLNTAGWPPGAARNGRWSRSGTVCWSPRGTSSTTRSAIRISARCTSSHESTQPGRPADWSLSCSSSAIRFS